MEQKLLPWNHRRITPTATDSCASVGLSSPKSQDSSCGTLGITRRQWLGAASLAALGISGCSVQESTSPRFPSELLEPYNPEAPPGPSFSADQIAKQWAAGGNIYKAILAAFHDGEASFTIPPGDYRFSSHYVPDAKAFLLRGLNRPANKPFTILAHGVTFWFPMEKRLPNYHLMVRLENCANITIQGLTVDSAQRGCMEGRIVKLDHANNQIVIRPLPGTRRIKLANPAVSDANRVRFLPFKANGDNMPALYQINRGWGPENDLFTNLTEQSDGTYRLQMKTRTLLDTTRDPAWIRTYGTGETLQVGDMIAVLYSVAAAFHIHDSKRITLIQCRSYAAKSFVSENGGYGAHRYIHCHLVSRPGTNNLLGGEGIAMSNGMMHGSLMDGVVTGRTTDDPYNNHSHWKLSKSMTPNSITFTAALPIALTPGDRVDIYHRTKPGFLASVPIESIQGHTLTFAKPLGILGIKPNDLAVFFPRFSNRGWVIRNCYFVNCYQRILVQCGHGLFENNYIHRMGDSLVLQTCFPDGIEGGNPSNITIRNNVFFDSCISPVISPIVLSGYMRPLRNVLIEGNVIFRSGHEAIRVDGAEELVIRNNLLVDPGQGYNIIPGQTVAGVSNYGAVPAEQITSGVAADQTGAVPVAMALRQVNGAVIANNALMGNTSPVAAAKGMISFSACHNITMRRNVRRRDSGEAAQRLSRWITGAHLSAAAILNRAGV